MSIQFIIPHISLLFIIFKRSGQFTNSIIINGRVNTFRLTTSRVDTDVQITGHGREPRHVHNKQFRSDDGLQFPIVSFLFCGGTIS